jgi:RNA polymerase sigma factor (sigma-70 family)
LFARDSKERERCAGEHRAALAAYDEMLKYVKKYEHPLFMRAIVRFRIGQSEPAREDLRKIMKENPKATWAQMMRAVFAQNEGHHFEEAEKDLRKSLIVELRYFGGLSIEETAEALGISTTTVKREWTMAKAWLRREMRQEPRL